MLRVLYLTSFQIIPYNEYGTESFLSASSRDRTYDIAVNYSVTAALSFSPFFSNLEDGTDWDMEAWVQFLMGLKTHLSGVIWTHSRLITIQLLQSSTLPGWVTEREWWRRGSNPCVRSTPDLETGSLDQLGHSTNVHEWIFFKSLLATRGVTPTGIEPVASALLIGLWHPTVHTICISTTLWPSELWGHLGTRLSPDIPWVNFLAKKTHPMVVHHTRQWVQ